MPTYLNLNQYLQELNRAESARNEGNEGMARVCARRAAGLLIREYMRRRGMEAGNSNAYALLKSMQSLPDIPDDVRIITGHFLIRVNSEGNLVDNIDLIADTRWLENKFMELERSDL